MTTKDATHSLELSILPAILASSCCLTLPALTLLGISFSENFFYEYRWLLRMLGVFVLGISLVWYFYKQGITNRKIFLSKKNLIIIITVQTALFATGFYILFLYVIVPVLCKAAELNSCIVI